MAAACLMVSKMKSYRGLAAIEETIGAGFGDAGNPLLVSVRSGARVSMPGMLDTILNLGLNDRTVEGLAHRSGDPRFAWDSYRRFIQMYGNVVLGIDIGRFEDLTDMGRARNNVALDSELEADDWRAVVDAFKQLIEQESGEPFPQDPGQQLWGAVSAVFDSWNNRRAQTYRQLHGIDASWGTAASVQAMVFGNMGNDCATGVFFTRNPSTGESERFGEYLVNAQGEDLVAGLRTPQALTDAGKSLHDDSIPVFEEAFPEEFRELCQLGTTLEQHFGDMQDIEFTIQQHRLWFLQTRSGKRTTKAALRIACDLVDEGLISRSDAVSRIDPEALNQLLHPVLDPDAPRVLLARGLPASPGAASGVAVFTADEAERMAAQGIRSILVRMETSPEDIHGMHAASGILTCRGGMTSHAAVVARGMGRPCVVGVGGARVDPASGCLEASGQIVRAGEMMTIDGTTGEVMLGEIASQQPEMSEEFLRLMTWADEIRTLGVRANAETTSDCDTAFGFGAEGIGLCRTEHMFFDSERIVAVREMILARSEEARQVALDKLLPMQRQDFVELFRIAHNRPVAVRLLDPPLHEFLPRDEAEIRRVASAAGVDADAVRARARELQEVNPMLGLRGCRLALSYPEIAEMQARAIFEAACEVSCETGQEVSPEVMIPLVFGHKEFDLLRERIDAVASRVFEDSGTSVKYVVGTMIELPRAALRAGEIAQGAEFFSFGTNDLTQTTFGLSRDDTGSLLSEYTRRGILETDPFVSLDVDGVGELVRMAAERGRKVRPDLKLGVCGEHGGDPASIQFCGETGLDYVSCSPYRVPVARLAAAQVALRLNRTE